MMDLKDQEEFKEKLLDLLDAYGASMTSEGDDGVFVEFVKGDADSFYFQKADISGFDT
jgi:hypothetical protein